MEERNRGEPSTAEEEESSDDVNGHRLRRQGGAVGLRAAAFEENDVAVDAFIQFPELGTKS